MRSVSRLVAALRDKGILCVRAEDRSFMGNKGQSFNRFRRYKPAEPFAFALYFTHAAFFFEYPRSQM